MRQRLERMERWLDERPRARHAVQVVSACSGIAVQMLFWALVVGVVSLAAVLSAAIVAMLWSQYGDVSGSLDAGVWAAMCRLIAVLAVCAGAIIGLYRAVGGRAALRDPRSREQQAADLVAQGIVATRLEHVRLIELELMLGGGAALTYWHYGSAARPRAQTLFDELTVRMAISSPSPPPEEIERIDAIAREIVVLQALDGASGASRDLLIVQAAGRAKHLLASTPMAQRVLIEAELLRAGVMRGVRLEHLLRVQESVGDLPSPVRAQITASAEEALG